MSGDIDRYRIDVACEHPLAEQLCRSDRQDPRSGTDIERAAKPVPRRQALERHQTSAGRRMLAGPERGCRVDHDSDGSGWNHSAIMRAIYKESSDPHPRREPGQERARRTSSSAFSHSSRALDEGVHDFLVAGDIETDRELVVLDLGGCAVSEFLMKHAGAG